MKPSGDLPSTHLSLFPLLYDLDPQKQDEAWCTFQQHYSPHFVKWCIRSHLEPSAAAEVTQGVLGKLFQSLRKFRYEPGPGRFRGYLKTVVSHAIADYLAERLRPGAYGTGDSRVIEQIAGIAAPESIDDLASTVSEHLEGEHGVALEVVRRVRKRVADATWEAFYLTAIEGLEGPEAAQRLGVPVARIYVYKARVQKILKEEREKVQKERDDELRVNGRHST